MKSVTVWSGTINHTYLRFFMWVWECEEDVLSTCSLFWGTLFLPVGFLLANKDQRVGYFGRVAFTYLFFALILLALKEPYIALVTTFFALCAGVIWGLRYLLRQRSSSHKEGAKETLEQPSKPTAIDRVTDFGTGVIGPSVYYLLWPVKVLFWVLGLALKLIAMPIMWLANIIPHDPPGWFEDTLEVLSYLLYRIAGGVSRAYNFLKSNTCWKIIIRKKNNK
ncbi:MAG: hypothetical protein UU77_C0001G0033 [candidate division WWE3 bacterium GW2011_GWC1_41_7]|uniref:Uncharacterized protein n=4 Tax=Katanobacteria TaxID=422282 RepID=A0A0G1A897_UNCKA|nr:MAG: hypothetical protein UU72_C0003G0034 [candidate division WWE3 bacterium GW2011_GWB1_41_6]KKS21538.1 MAG: hypothetical protein UU77_C0001G0033 [candidate division WWE3 bacterium GW2011_GWC1_41_7]KKS22504.1 MAG: hypothetical protein UU80_C0006G0030 [candidate division WWE3 bacterium GW2011_GWA1_41_8]